MEDGSKRKETPKWVSSGAREPSQVMDLDQFPSVRLGDGVSPVVDSQDLEYVPEISLKSCIAYGEQGGDLLG